MPIPVNVEQLRFEDGWHDLGPGWVRIKAGLPIELKVLLAAPPGTHGELVTRAASIARYVRGDGARLVMSSWIRDEQLGVAMASCTVVEG